MLTFLFVDVLALGLLSLLLAFFSEISYEIEVKISIYFIRVYTAAVKQTSWINSLFS